MTRSAKIKTRKKLFESLRVADDNEGELRGTTAAFLEKSKIRRASPYLNRPMALQREDKVSPRVGKTGLQYKFQRSSATVTHSRS